jgi:protein-L-isoaspartate(D-aspartate) O-methyltransferase
MSEVSMGNPDLVQARRFFAEELRAAAPVRRNDSVVEAFATVPRERFLGPGPWRIIPPKWMGAAYETPDSDPRRVYHDVLVAIDPARSLNNGEPGLWARLFDQLNLRPGERIMQVGAGTGYYSAVLAEIVGARGSVVAVEYDAGLAAAARENLRPWPQVEVVAGDATSHDPGEVDGIVTFAGMTHPGPLWLDRLRDGGRLLMALTAADRWGFFLCATRRGTSFDATPFGRCGIFPCIGARDDGAAERLQEALRALKGEVVPVRSLYRGDPLAESADVWYAAPGFWLSTGAVLTR